MVSFFMLPCKGHLISKRLFSILNSPKNKQKSQLYYYDTSGRLVFVRFLREIEDTNKSFRNYLTFSKERSVKVKSITE